MAKLSQHSRYHKKVLWKIALQFKFIESQRVKKLSVAEAICEKTEIS